MLYVADMKGLTNGVSILQQIVSFVPLVCGMKTTLMTVLAHSMCLSLCTMPYTVLDTNDPWAIARPS